MSPTPRLSLSSLFSELYTAIFVCTGTLMLVLTSVNPASAQMGKAAPFSRVVLGPIAISSSTSTVTSHAGGSGPGLIIIPTFDSSVDAATQAVINRSFMMKICSRTM